MVVKCPKCNHFVSNVITVCPHCGYNFKEETLVVDKKQEPVVEPAPIPSKETEESAQEPESIVEAVSSEISREEPVSEAIAEQLEADTQVEATETYIPEINQAPEVKKDRKWFYILGVVAVLAVGVGFGIKKYMDANVSVQLLPSRPVIWEKFLTPISSAHIYDQPDINMLLTDEKAEKGYIVPVLGETQSFYKVYLGEGKEGWVKKNQWREVAADPITQDMATEIFLSGEHLDNMTRHIDEGDLKDLMLCYYKDFTSSGHLDVGILDNGRLIRPLNSSVEAVPVDGSGLTVIPATDSEGGKIEFGTNYQITEESFQQFLDFSKLSKKQIAEIWKAAQGSNPYKVWVTYYFATEQAFRTYDVDLSVFGSDSNNSSRLVEEGNAGLSDFTYGVEGTYDKDSETTFYQLNAVTASGEKVNTEIVDGAVQLNIVAQGDLDGDGLQEAVVYEWGGGNAIAPPYLVYYDSQEEKFKKVEGFDIVSEEPEIKIEEWNNQQTLVCRVGIRTDRYTYSDHTLSVVERNIPDVGTHMATVSLAQLFKDDDDGVEKSIYIDIDGDGSTEKLTFYHDSSHALNWGKAMLLLRIEADDWRIPENTDDQLGISGETFTFLSVKTNGVPNLLCDDAWIFKWDGSNYVMQSN